MKEKILKTQKRKNSLIKLKKEAKGITLIALVVTIIVLLILSAVAINLTIGNNGIFTRALDAKEKTEISQEKEWITLAISGITLDLKEVNATNLETEIKNISNRDVAVSGDEILTVLYKDSKRKYKIENGKIIEDGVKNEQILLDIEKDETLVLNELEMILYIDISDFDIYEAISYEDFAKQILNGKSEQEKEQIFLDGVSYWDMQYGYIDKPYTSLEEVFQKFYENGRTDIKCETLEDLCEDRKFDNVDEMLIRTQSVSPELYDFNLETAIKDNFEITVINPDGEEIILKNEVFYPYLATENKDYTFTVKFKGKEASITTTVDNIVPTVNVEKHPDQSEENNTIGIDEKGNPVNMDLWNYTLNYDEYDLTTMTKNVYGSEWIIGGDGYKGEYTEDGRINGEVPAFIKEEDDTTFYPVTKMSNTFSIFLSPDSDHADFSNNERLIISPSIPKTVREMNATFENCINLNQTSTIPDGVTNMHSTFYNCTNLTQAPTIPDSVTDLEYTFYYCTNLTQAPTIPNSVTDMSSTFSGCTNLTQAPTIPDSVTDLYYTFYYCTNLSGELIINANPQYYSACLTNASTDPEAHLVLKGSSNMLTEIFNTKSDNSNITM